MTSCCRENSSPDVVLYQQIDAVVRALTPEKIRADLSHPVKGPKLRALIERLKDTVV